MLTKLVRIRWLTRCSLNFENGTTLLDEDNHVMDTRFELQYKAVAEIQ